jgi:L-asparaginase
MTCMLAQVMYMNRVYILYTGGTIGSTGHPLAPMSGPQFIERVLSIPALAHFRVEHFDDLEYSIDFLDTPLDSADVTASDWLIIARRILSNYTSYDGFVILHGTDTMAWAASALSFLLNGLTKPVIFTGSQLPLEHPLSDAQRNLIASLILAGTTGIPEVCIFFNTALMRGNRTIKADTSEYDAFLSPNYPVLATAGTNLAVKTPSVLPSPPLEISLAHPANIAALQASLEALPALARSFSVVTVTLFPGIQTSNMLATLLQQTRPPIKGVVLGGFGAGNAPLSQAFLDTIANANEQGVTIVGSTQVIRGSTTISTYQTGAGLLKAGVISGYDLTLGTALTKLTYLLAQDLDQERVKVQMQTNIRGEMTILTS